MIDGKLKVLRGRTLLAVLASQGAAKSFDVGGRQRDHQLTLLSAIWLSWLAVCRRSRRAYWRCWPRSLIRGTGGVCATPDGALGDGVVRFYLALVCRPGQGIHGFPTVSLALAVTALAAAAMGALSTRHPRPSGGWRPLPPA